MLEKTTYEPREVIRGQVVLKLKKPIRARGLYVSLMGRKLVPDRDFDLVREPLDLDLKWENICEKTITLGGEGVYSEVRYNFELPVPYTAAEHALPPSGRISRSLENIGLGLGEERDIKWCMLARLDIPKAIDVSAKQEIQFRRRTEYKRLNAGEEERETPRSWVDVGDRRAQAAYGFKDVTHDEVYAEGVLFCPQCETPYHPRRGRRQCDHCGAYLP